MALYIGNKKFDGIITSHSTTIHTVDTTDANAAASDIINNKTAYVNKQKITGTLILSNFYVSENDTEPDSSIGNDGDLYFIKGV